MRRILALVLAALMLLSMAACASSTTATPAATETTASTENAETTETADSDRARTFAAEMNISLSGSAYRYPRTYKELRLWSLHSNKNSVPA